MIKEFKIVNKNILSTNLCKTIALIIAIVYSHSFSKNLYLAPYGNDNTSYNENSINSPWKTISYSWLNLLPGDTLFIREGTYTIPQTLDLSNGAPNGTEDKRVVVTNYDNEEVVVEGSGNGYPLVFVDREYHHINGITFYGDDINWAVLYVGYDYSGQNTIISNCKIQIRSTPDVVDCTAPIRLGTTLANFTQVYNCNLIGTQNTSGIIIFKSQGIKVYNNTITNSEHGIFIKHSNALNDDKMYENQFCNNFIYGCFYSGVMSVANYSLFKNNLIIGSSMIFGIDGGVGDGWVGADYNTIDHNTVYNGALNLEYEIREEDPNKGCLNNTITNNIFTKSCFWHPYADIDNANIKSNHNLFPINTTIIKENRVDYSLAEWKQHNNSDSYSLTGVPEFAGNQLSNIEDFILKESSIGYKAGSDGLDIGADISKLIDNPIETSINHKKKVYNNNIMKINSVNNTLHFNINTSQKTQKDLNIAIFNLLGQQVLNLKLSNNYNTTIKHSLSKGIYVVSLLNRNSIIYSKQIKIIK